MKIFQFMRKPRDEHADEERRELLAALHETHNLLESARLIFDRVSEPELVDASVFEINSLQARYSYLLRKAREEGCVSGEVFRMPR